MCMFLTYFCSIFPALPEARWKQAAVTHCGSFPLKNTVYFSIREREVFGLLLSVATLRVSRCLLQSRSKWE